MHKALLAGLEFHLSAYGQYVNYLAQEHFTNLYVLDDIVYHLLCGGAGFLIGRQYEHAAVVVYVYLHAGIGNDLIDGLAAGADDFADLIGIDAELQHPGRIGRKLRAGLRKGFEHLIQYEQPAAACLCKRAGQNLFINALYLYIHLNGGYTVLGACNLEVHIPKEVLKALYIGHNGYVAVGGILNKAHGNARNGLLDGYARIHEGQGACADGSL